ncbi:MAG: cytidylate kinase-like family protein [Eubacteriales bacterium]|nr:cytidylate kinase-like family protein [Eubacteriales bacterium]MDD3874799.1 cytidylate kinase-like family protein [Methanosarcina sp.]MDD4583163.1 cytidylate kinase-like family protein [Eubacteriales bacterium]
MSGKIIVTVSRQAGCGGLEIGQRLARQLSAIYVDKKTIAKASEGLDAVLKVNDDTKVGNRFWELLGKTPILYDMESYIPEMRSIVSDSQVHEKEEEILLKLAGQGPAVVVGRGGFHRFRDYPKVIHLFLSGDQEYRIENYKRIFCLEESDAKALLLATDQATERYVRKVTGNDMLDTRNYDLVINVSKLDFNCVIELVLDYIHYRFER